MKNRWVCFALVLIGLAVGFAGSMYLCNPFDCGEHGVTYFPIYSYDDLHGEVLEYCYIPIPVGTTLEEKMLVLADDLSRLIFRGIPIIADVKTISDGKELLVVDLLEDSTISGASWKIGFFQGSAGGATTSHTLIETFLQRDYDLDWIDGIVFTHEGGGLNDWGHIPLMSDTVWREAREVR